LALTATAATATPRALASLRSSLKWSLRSLSLAGCSFLDATALGRILAQAEETKRKEAVPQLIGIREEACEEGNDAALAEGTGGAAGFGDVEIGVGGGSRLDGGGLGAAVSPWGVSGLELVSCGLPLLRSLDLAFCPALDGTSLAVALSASPALRTSLQVLSLRGIKGLGSGQRNREDAAQNREGLGGGSTCGDSRSALAAVCRACPLLVQLDVSYTSMSDDDVQTALLSLGPHHLRVFLLDSCLHLTDHLIDSVFAALACETATGAAPNTGSRIDEFATDMFAVALGGLRLFGLRQCAGLSLAALGNLKQFSAVRGEQLRICF